MPARPRSTGVRPGRRAFLRALALGSAGLLAACQAPARPAPAGGTAPAAKAASGAADFQARWDALVAAAQQEGLLVVHGPPTPETRQMVPAAFTRRFGIPVEYNAVRTSELAARMVTEKQAGLITIDVMLTGLSSYADILYPNGLLADLRSALILPEVTDSSVWTLEPADLFLDPEHNKLLRLFYTSTAMVAVNREHVDPARIKVAADLLQPELKGKTSAEDPTVPGSGANVAAYYLLQFGEEFVSKLYREQVVISRENRQRADWLVRGSQPVALSLNAAELDKVLKDGFPIEVIRSLEDVTGVTGSAFGVVGLIEGAPHPNAARLFVNWIASREGLEVFSRSERVAGTRRDLDYTQWVPEFSIPLPGVNYLDTYNWDWKGRQQPAAAEKLKEILARR